MRTLSILNGWPAHLLLCGGDQGPKSPSKCWREGGGSQPPNTWTCHQSRRCLCPEGTPFKAAPENVRNRTPRKRQTWLGPRGGRTPRSDHTFHTVRESDLMWTSPIKYGRRQEQPAQTCTCPTPVAAAAVATSQCEELRGDLFAELGLVLELVRLQAPGPSKGGRT